MLRTLSAGLVVALVAGSAQATWSIIIVDTRTKEVGIASATCLNNLDLRSRTPAIVVERGAGVGQSFGDNTNINRTYMRDGLLALANPNDILAGLASIDGAHQTRQYGLVNTLGQSMTFSGSSNGAWAGGQTGTVEYTIGGVSGTLAYAVQGNVLTGPGVVQAAVDAIRAANAGDLPSRLIAGMQAARLAGGDGRCSCTGDAPTSCGDPPPPFTYSSFIAFYTIARSGDEDACMPIYGTNQARDVLPVQLVGSDLPDIITPQSAPGGIRLFRNITEQGDAPLPFRGTQIGFALAQTLTTTGTPTGFSAGPMFGGGNDIVMSLASTGQFLGGFDNQDGTFVSATSASQLTDAPTVLLANLDADTDLDVIAFQQSVPRLQLFRNDFPVGANPVYSSVASVPLPAGSISPVVLDIDEDGRQDTAMLVPGSNVVRLQRRTASDFAFAPAENLTVGTTASLLQAGDFDDDGDTDLLTVHGTPPRVQLHRNTAGVFQAGTDQPISLTSVLGAGVGDLNGDAFPDVAVVGGDRVAILLGGAGGLTAAGFATYRLPSLLVPSFRTVRIADLDGDGDGDLVLRSQGSPQAWTVLENVGPPEGQPYGSTGTFLAPNGCAEGTYFQNFNVTGTAANGPDPVAVLQQQFDASRASLEGVPDAIRSTAFPDAPLIAGGVQRSLIIELSDHRGIVAPFPSGTIARVDRIDTDGASTVLGVPVYFNATGVIQVRLTPIVAGTDVLRIAIEIPGRRPIVLMPRTVVAVQPFVGTCDSVDFNNDGSFFDPTDVDAFLQVFSEGPCVPPGAQCNDVDFNNDGSQFDPCDIDAFLLVFSEGPCTLCGL
jgi:hypothetical protein